MPLTQNSAMNAWAFAGGVYTAVVNDENTPSAEQPSGETPRVRRRPHREGVLLIAAMVISGLITVSVSVWILKQSDLIGMSVREDRTAEQMRGPQQPPNPVQPIRRDKP